MITVEIDHVFEIECPASGETAYADEPEDVVCAVRELLRAAAIQGATCTVRNLDAGTIVWTGRRVDRPSL